MGPCVRRHYPCGKHSCQYWKIERYIIKGRYKINSPFLPSTLVVLPTPHLYNTIFSGAHSPLGKANLLKINSWINNMAVRKLSDLLVNCLQNRRVNCQNNWYETIVILDARRMKIESITWRNGGTHHEAENQKQEGPKNEADVIDCALRL